MYQRRTVRAAQRHGFPFPPGVEAFFVPLTETVMRRGQCQSKPKIKVWGGKSRGFALLIKLAVELPQHAEDKLLQRLEEDHEMQTKMLNTAPLTDESLA